MATQPYEGSKAELLRNSLIQNEISCSVANAQTVSELTAVLNALHLLMVNCSRGLIQARPLIQHLFRTVSVPKAFTSGADPNQPIFRATLREIAVSSDIPEVILNDISIAMTNCPMKDEAAELHKRMRTSMSATDLQALMKNNAGKKGPGDPEGGNSQFDPPPPPPCF